MKVEGKRVRKKTIRNITKKRREPPTNPRSTLLDTTGTPAFLPYIVRVTDRIGKILKKRDIRTVFNTSNKLHSRLVNVKDRPARLATAGIYSIPCSCGLLYIRQTGRTAEERRKEHIRYCKLHQDNVAEATRGAGGSREEASADISTSQGIRPTPKKSVEAVPQGAVLGPQDVPVRRWWHR
ncbi:hypothetical protein C0J52_27938 [Blattella germanica]|nr:hypothetical protein C0J52_27938 [Blattella germanica]